jgi:hypothetical protein
MFVFVELKAEAVKQVAEMKAKSKKEKKGNVRTLLFDDLFECLAERKAKEAEKAKPAEAEDEGEEAEGEAEEEPEEQLIDVKPVRMTVGKQSLLFYFEIYSCADELEQLLDYMFKSVPLHNQKVFAYGNFNQSEEFKTLVANFEKLDGVVRYFDMLGKPLVDEDSRLKGHPAVENLALYYAMMADLVRCSRGNNGRWFDVLGFQHRQISPNKTYKPVISSIIVKRGCNHVDDKSDCDGSCPCRKHGFMCTKSCPCGGLKVFGGKCESHIRRYKGAHP